MPVGREVGGGVINPLAPRAAELLGARYTKLAAGGVDWKPYAKLIGERPHAVKVAADRKADQERMLGASKG